MEQLTKAIEDNEHYEFEVYRSPDIVEGFFILGFLVLLGAVVSGMIICGCCIAGTYAVSKYCLQPNNNYDPNTPYQDVSVELKEVTPDLENLGTQLEITNEVEIAGKAI